MKTATKQLLDEIDVLLGMLLTFPERYNKNPNNILPDLYEDFVFFQTRLQYIFAAANKHEHDGFIKRFRIAHVQLNKSQIDPIDEDFIQAAVILKSFKRELENGLIYKVSDLARVEIFGSFMESAEYLLDAGWKDAAAVIIGGVLEDKLRDMSIKNNLQIIDAKGKKLTIDPLNVALKQKGVYDLLLQKRIIVYAEIRNHAAHAEYKSYNEEDVKDMYKFVRNFITEF